MGGPKGNGRRGTGSILVGSDGVHASAAHALQKLVPELGQCRLLVTARIAQRLATLAAVVLHKAHPTFSTLIFPFLRCIHLTTP